MLIEARIVVKDEESTLSKKFLHYTDVEGDIIISEDSGGIRKMVEETVKEFGKAKDQITNIIVNFKIIWE